MNIFHFRSGIALSRTKMNIKTYYLLIMSTVSAIMSMNYAHAQACYALNTPSLKFSSYHPSSRGPDDIETTVDFYCAPAFRGKQLHIKVSLQEGAQGSAYQIRNAFGDVLRFGIFLDPARSIPLTSNMTIPVRDANPQNKTFSVVLYGRIYADQRTAGVGQYRGYFNLLLER